MGVDLRKLLRIARWEVRKNAGGVDRRTVAVAAVAVLALAALAPAVASQGTGLDRGLYRVAVDDESPYRDVLASDPTFAVRPGGRAALDRGAVDLYVRGYTVRAADSPKGRAAVEELRSSVRRYNDRQLRGVANQTAAFPVAVVVRYDRQDGVGSVYRPAGDGTDAGSGSGDGSADDAGGTDSGDETTGGTATPTGTETAGSADGDGVDTTATPDSETATPTGAGPDGSGDADGTATGDGAGGDSATPSGGSDADGPAGGGLDALGGLVGGQRVDSPSEIAPPFPFQSLVLAFVFVIPLNFLIQAYGSTVLSERLNRRGELLLVAPVSRLEIVGGKTLPYLLAALTVEGAIALGLTYLTQGTVGGVVSFAAVVPLVCLFLATTFLGAMFARSFKELTFVTVAITVGLTSFAFVPAIFTDVNPIALISPLTVVVRALQNQTVTAPEFAFATLPSLLSAAVLFGLGVGLYREEDMFAQRAIPLKVLDALAARVRQRWHVLALTALLLPFVFVLELLAIATLFALRGLSIPLVLVAVAVIEEAAKSLHVYAGYAHDRFDRGLRAAAVLGVLSGVGFFLGEKITLLAQLVGLPELAVGRAALDPVGGPLLVAFLLAPLALHVVTATVSAVGASRGRRPCAAALAAAIALHLAYNYTVVVLLG